MSKKSKSISREKRLKAKRSKRAANNALYASYRDAGKNGKRTKSKQSAGRTGHPHSQSCGNIGCLKCSSVARKGHLALMAKTGGPALVQRICRLHNWITE